MSERMAAVDDAQFDRLFPSSQRFRSWMHWTPVEVAVRAAALLAPGHERVLDIGAGVGKLCLIGAATTSASWVGIEQNADMVNAANAARVRLGLETRVRFIRGDIAHLDWTSFDSFYLFNPFAEMLFVGDGTPLERRERYVATIEFVQSRLARAATGTRVVTYHGFGGDMPRGFECVHYERAREDELRLWIKRSRRSHAG